MINRVLRHVPTWPALFVTVALVAGCGTSTSATSTNMGTSLSRAQISAYAKAVNLRASDVPDVEARASEHEVRAGTRNPQIARCGGAIPGLEPHSIESVALVSSFDFSPSTPPEVLATIRVTSAIKVVASEAIARQRVAADASVHVQRCLARVFSAGDEDQPLVSTHFAVERLPATLHGVPRLYGLTIALTKVTRSANPALSPTTTHISQDIMVFDSGPAEVALLYVHRTPLSTATTEQRLLALLYRRAATNRP